MRIAVVSNTSWSIHNFRRNLIAALVKEGHDVLAIGSLDEYLERLQAQGISATGVPFSRDGIHPIRELRTVLAIRRALTRHRTEVVLSFTPKGNIYAALAAWGLQSRQVVNVSGLGRVFARKSALTYLMLLLYRLTFRRAHHVFFQNDEDRAMFLARGLVDPAKATRLPGSGVDLTHFAPAPIRHPPSDGPVFLMHGRLLWDKGVREFVEAARLLKPEYPGTRYNLLGAHETTGEQGPTLAHLEAWAKAGTVEYLGRVDDVRPHIEAVDCVVLPSGYGEGVPRSLLEASAMGRPVIACNIAGCRDAVAHQQTGFLCKPRDAHDLAAVMRQFIALGREAQEQMGHKGREKMKREFDEQGVIQAYLRVIHDMPRREAH
jgi:glycosyltransferase involved in cell wall biosynthesis